MQSPVIVALLSLLSTATLSRAVEGQQSDTLKTVLRRLAAQQENYYAVHGTYTTDVSSLGLGGHRGDTVFVQVAFAGGRGWTGVASQRGAKRSCVIYVGSRSE